MRKNFLKSRRNLLFYLCYTKTANNVILDVRDGICQGVLYCPTSIRFHGKCDVIYAYRKSTAFPALIFTKHANDQQHHVLISYTEFNPCQIINVESYGQKIVNAPGGSVT
jgi:hypothetical protein